MSAFGDDEISARYVRTYDSLRGRVRTELIDRQLALHLGPPPGPIVDIGGGAGHQSLPLARRGYEVVLVDPSPAMLARAEAVFAEVADRVTLIQASGEAAAARLGSGRFTGVLCHGVVMYVDEPAPLVDNLAALAAPGGIVSIVAKNAAALAMRPAMRGDWPTALRSFAGDAGPNGLGLDTRPDTVEGLTAFLAERGVETVEWYGVRLFTDGRAPERPPGDDADDVIAVEWEAARRDPYRQLSRLFHLVGRKVRGPGDPAG